MPALNAERHFENGHCNMPDQRRAVVAGLVGGKVERTLGKENDRPERPEKPERRPNSKELIEKQRNWTSHFSKTRPSRYNSDPNRSLVQTSLNSQNATHNATQQQQSSIDGLCQSSSTTSATNDTASPARSASFCSARSPPPPLPPVRNSSAAGRRERPASIAALSPSDLPESPEYATIEKFDDISPTIPEYAVVQKTRKPQESSKETQDSGSDKIQDSAVPEYAVVQKNNSKSVSRPADSQKEAFKTAQNFKNSLAAEVACKPVVSRSSESPKNASKVSSAQNSKDPTTVEAAPTCKNAFPKLADVPKETSKGSATAEEMASFKTVPLAVPRPTESLKETVDCSKEISRSPVATETVVDTKIAITKECNDLPEQTKPSLVLHYELSSPIRSSTSVDSAQLTRKESDLLEAPEYLNCPPSPIHSPAKTSEWRNEWLAKNDEILKRTVDIRDLKSSSREALEAEITRGEVTRPDPRPDWARPSANAKRKETTSDDKRNELMRSPESELGLPSSAGTDSASSSMSSPSSPSKDSKEEKAEKEMSEKHQTGEFLVVSTVVFVVL